MVGRAFLQCGSTRTIPRGARHRARRSRHNLVFGRSARIGAMMQSCASATKLRGGGSILHSGLEAMVFTSDHRHLGFHRQTPSMGSPSWLSCCPSLSIVVAYDAGRKTMPSDTSPLVARRQSAMSSLRASATIIVLRVPARLSAVRAANHWAKALSFWNLRKRQANWIMPHRTRVLPARARPRSRRRLPLSSGEPVRPA